MFSKECTPNGKVSGGGGNTLGIREHFFKLEPSFLSWCVSVHET